MFIIAGETELFILITTYIFIKWNKTKNKMSLKYRTVALPFLSFFKEFIPLFHTYI